MKRAGSGHIYSKVLRTYLLVSLLPVLCLAVFTLMFTRDYSVNKVRDELDLLTQGAAGVLNRELELDEESLGVFAGDESVAQFLSQPSGSQDDIIQLNQKMFLVTGGKSQSVSLMLVQPSGYIVHSTSGWSGMPENAHDYWGVLRKLDGVRSIVYYSGIYGGSGYGLTMAKPISYGGEVVGYAMLGISERAFKNILETYDAPLPVDYMLFDENYYMVLDEISDTRSMFMPASFRDIVNAGECTSYESDVGEKLISAQPLDKAGLKLAANVSVGLVVSNNKKLAVFVSLMCIAALAAALIASRHLARGFAQPIQKMCKTIEEIEDGNMDARAPDLGNDELGTMARGFNLMIEQLQEQFRTNLERQDRLRIAEFKNLQAQISPHFLYNTLETIKILAKLGMNDEVGVVVSKLGILLRSGMNFKQEMIPLKDELHVVESYIAIQQVRLEDKFTYTENISPELMDCMVPNLVVQPLVENAVVHGIEAKRGTGILELTGWLEGNDVYIEIYDNGEGIDQKTLDRIFKGEAGQTDEETPARVSIGMLNVHRRLKLYYGDSYGLSVESKPGFYTRVRLHIPKVEGSVYSVQSSNS